MAHPTDDGGAASGDGFEYQHAYPNIYEEGELFAKATVKQSLTVCWEGKRDVRRKLDFYNLDMIIPVGYRIKSLIATVFESGFFYLAMTGNGLADSCFWYQA